MKNSTPEPTVGQCALYRGHILRIAAVTKKDGKILVTLTPDPVFHVPQSEIKLLEER